MVRLSEAMKDALSCEKSGGSCTEATIPEYPNGAIHYSEPVVSRKGSQPGELKHLSSQRKRNRRDSASSGERQRKSPNQGVYSLGL